MANEYATLKEFRTRVGLKDDDRIDDKILRAVLESASRHIDERTGREFFTSSGPRIFEPVFGDLLVIDDASAVTEVAFDPLDLEDWTAIPVCWTPNPGSPITSLRMRGWSPVAFTDSPRVQVTATWGHPLPKQIIEATLLVAARLFHRKTAPFGIAGTSDAGMIRLSKADPDVESLLAPFVRYRADHG